MAFGQEDYDKTAPIDLDEMFSAEDWDAKPNTSPLEPGKYVMRLIKFEKGTNEKGSVWFNFFFNPYSTEDGELIEGFPAKMNIRKYFYVGNNSSGKMITNSFSVNFTNFLQSIGVTKENHSRKFNNESLEGILVTGTLRLGERRLATKPDPRDGTVYTEIDPENPYSYTQYLEFDDSPAIGVRDASGNVKRVY